MQQLKPVDVVIAGGGFVGLTLAKEITARTSLSVLVLERGQPRKTSDYATGMDEPGGAPALYPCQEPPSEIDSAGAGAPGG